VPFPTLFPLPPGVVEPAGGDIMLSARTSRTAEPGKPYAYQLGHCGIGSPIDFDGSLWDQVGGQNGHDGPVLPDGDQAGELVNSSSGSMMLVGVDDAIYRTRSGLVVGLRRHDGPKGFPGCA
jgi:hypothetical protein